MTFEADNPQDHQEDLTVFEQILMELKVISIILCDMQDEERDNLIKDMENE